MDEMANKMFSGFGMGSMLMKDPFANDPFFSDSGKSPFGRMDEMINKMRGDMDNAMQMSSLQSSMGNGSRFVKQTSKTTSKMGPDGR